MSWTKCASRPTFFEKGESVRDQTSGFSVYEWPFPVLPNKLTMSVYSLINNCRPVLNFVWFPQIIHTNARKMSLYMAGAASFPSFWINCQGKARIRISTLATCLLKSRSVSIRWQSFDYGPSQAGSKTGKETCGSYLLNFRASSLCCTNIMSSQNENVLK